MAWTEITALESGYFAVGDPYAQPAYRREGSTLKLRGAVEQDSDSPEVIFDGPVFTLPEADRPSETQVVSISRREPAGDILAASIVVAADGTVSPASTEWPDQALFLDGVEIDLPITVAPDAADWAPSVEDVANQLRARTKGGVSEMDEVGTFDATTRPTGDEVEALIAGAVEDIRGVFTAADVPEDCQALAKRAATLKTALFIELSYFPEQASDNSPYLQLRALSDNAMGTLVAKATMLDAFGEDPEPANDLPVDGVEV